MHSLSEARLLEVWEQGREAAPWRRALLLLSAAESETPLDELARLSIGDRDGRLLSAYTETFGPELQSVARCPSCGARLEFDLDARTIQRRTTSEAGARLHGQTGTHRYSFRLPNSLDLAAISSDSDPLTVKRGLLGRCIESFERRDGGKPSRSEELPEEAIADIAERMGQADPMADIQVGLECLDCGHGWELSLDIASFFWRELDDWANGTMEDIHVLATTYGWTEPEIMSLTAFRRSVYLNLATA